MTRRLLTLLASVALSGGCLFADTMVWEVTGNNQFGTANLTTGTFTGISDLLTPGGVGQSYTPAGLGEFDDKLYAPMENGTGLISVDRLGHTSFVGESNVNYYAFGSTNTGLYMVNSAGALFSINPGTGAATQIGSTGLNMGSSQYYGMSSGSNVLYMSLGSNVYTINTDTGLASYIGNTGQTDFGALVDVSGTVYGTSTIAPMSVYTFDPITGKAAFITDSNGPDYSFGMAPIVPEPASFALFGVGAALLSAYAVKRRKA